MSGPFSLGFFTIALISSLAFSNNAVSQEDRVPTNSGSMLTGPEASRSAQSSPPTIASTPTSDRSPFTIATVPWKPRLNFNQILEPKGDAVLIGAGQENYPAPSVDLSDYTNFATVVGINPSVIMLYQSVSESPTAVDAWASAIATELEKISSSDLILLQIGYDLLDETKLKFPGSRIPPIDSLVAYTNRYDANINAFCEALRKIGRPVYLRIGFEFNGRWNGHRPESYKASFRKIALKLRNRQCGVPLATVWHYSMDDKTRFESFYPGDTYVDWFGISVFGPITQAGRDLINSATVAGKPVMIGESTPRGVGAQKEENPWFQEYFNFIYSNPSIKQFGYINWDWSNPAYGFANLGWGDARIPANSHLAKTLHDELINRQYMQRLRGNNILDVLNVP
jgi:hypothetical protein